MMDAVNRLPEGVQKPDRDLLLKLLGMGMEIEKRNRIVNGEAAKWYEFFRMRGYKAVLLKGQGVAHFYPNPLHRNPGDIDLWVIGRECEVRELARKELGAENVTYHHIGVHNGGMAELEIHTTPSWMYSYPKNRRLQRLFAQWADSGMEIELPDAGRVCVPSDEMNRVYMLVHMYRHVFSEGIGLRQMMDYAMLLKRGCTEEDAMLLKRGCTEEEKTVFGRQAKELNLYGFAGAVMYVMGMVFGMKDECLLVKPDTEKGEKLLASIMKGGNFGMYDSSIDRTIKKDSAMSFLTRNARNFRLLKEYPEEVLWSPIFKIWHWIWRKIVYKTI